MSKMGFLALTLALTAGWMQIYSAARESFNGVNEYKEKLNVMQENERKLKIAAELNHEQLIEFRQQVATLMPEAVKIHGDGEEGYPIRNLASVVGKTESESVQTVLAKTLFEQGKNNFRDKKYEKAKADFKKVISKYSYTTYLTESYFLLAESHFQLGEIEECTTVIQQMVDLFPQHELTGFAMVRLGRIFEMQNRTDEAVEIYKTVMRSFPQRDVASQAKASIKGLSL